MPHRWFKNVLDICHYVWLWLFLCENIQRVRLSGTTEDRAITLSLWLWGLKRGWRPVVVHPYSSPLAAPLGGLHRSKCKKSNNFIWLNKHCIRCVWVCIGCMWTCHSAHRKVRGQLVGVSFLLPPCRSGERTLVVRLTGKWPHCWAVLWL